MVDLSLHVFAEVGKYFPQRVMRGNNRARMHLSTRGKTAEVRGKAGKGPGRWRCGAIWRKKSSLEI